MQVNTVKVFLAGNMIHEFSTQTSVLCMSSFTYVGWGSAWFDSALQPSMARIWLKPTMVPIEDWTLQTQVYIMSHITERTNWWNEYHCSSWYNVIFCCPTLFYTKYTPPTMETLPHCEKDIKALTNSLIPYIQIQSSINGTCRKKSDPRTPHPCPGVRHHRASPEVLFLSLNGSEPTMSYLQWEIHWSDLLQQGLWLLIRKISGKFGCQFNNINASWANPEKRCSVHCPAEGPLLLESVVAMGGCLQQCLGGWLFS